MTGRRVTQKRSAPAAGSSLSAPNKRLRGAEASGKYASAGSPCCSSFAGPVRALRAAIPRTATSKAAVREACNAVHQVGVVEGSYDSKEHRLAQLLDRLPGDGGLVLLLCSPTSSPAACAVLERCASARARATGDAKVDTGAAMQAQSLPPVIVAMLHGRDCTQVASFPGVGGSASLPGRCTHIINYDLPTTSREYIRRLAAFEGRPGTIEAPNVVFTLVTERQLRSRSCKELARLLERTGHAAILDKSLGGIPKAAEIDSALLQIKGWDEEDEEDEDSTTAGSSEASSHDCDCECCRSGTVRTSLVPAVAPAFRRAVAKTGQLVEVVHIPLRALENLDAIAGLIAPQMSGHGCTVIGLHCLYNHTPWDGNEHLFAPPANLVGVGAVRVVLVLAEDSSWHDYPDHHTLCGGGVSWVDILDMESMDRADRLIERLVDHEASLLDERSERVFLMGMSQGGGQSMLRFLRSKRRLGGWIGSVCHAPTAPHVPRDRDPLLADGRPLLNRNRPIRLLAGEADSVFAPGLVLRDAARLRNVGGFTDVEVELRKGLSHSGQLDGAEDVAADLHFLRQHWPRLLQSTCGSVDDSTDSQ